MPAEPTSLLVQPHFLQSPECGVTGAAMLAGLATGIYASPAEAVAAHVGRERIFEPDSRRHAFYQDKARRHRQLYPALSGLLRRT